MANPASLSRLSLDGEERKIKQALDGVKAPKAKIEVGTLPNCRLEDLSREIINFHPNIVHFSGHGQPNAEGKICFVRDLGSLQGLPLRSENKSDPSLTKVGGDVQEVPPQALGDLFALARPALWGVILNSCYSVDQAAAIGYSVPSLIAMDGELDDFGVQSFSKGFYEALAAGESFDVTFEWGKNKVDILQLKDVNPRLNPHV